LIIPYSTTWVDSNADTALKILRRLNGSALIFKVGVEDVWPSAFGSALTVEVGVDDDDVWPRAFGSTLAVRFGVTVRTSLHAFTYLKFSMADIDFSSLRVEGTSLLKARMLRELIRISVVNIAFLRLVSDGTSMIAA
jgi:hypothetical protein